ncbi:stimulator of interferon genes protein-like isoform X3 [Vespa mandarinia]|uniref:stimulator of interferon genes protein-like isoform X3 n=1 Tax=Vespa mandarinia TaxID=7446 RepID=UPI00161CC3B0|nr:stimulator of interferon genes protein-like isoform X3 [Vespa mandarinia]
MDHLSMRNESDSVYVSLNIILYYILEIIFIVIAVMIKYEDNITSTICNISYIVSILIIMYILCDLTIQLCNLLNTNLKLNRTQLLEIPFKYKIAIGICIIFITLQTINKGFFYIWRYNNITFICLYCFVIILFKIPVLSQQNLDTNVINMNGLDYGTGMAYNYYYGYLRIILPSTGTENKDLKQLSYEWMENVQELEQEVRNRAGIKNRSYHNNIYKIYPGGNTNSIEPVYLAVEGATPLLTFFEVQKHFHPESKIYKKYSRQIIEAFYLKLKELIYNDLDCRDLCELIYYEDYNSDGTKVNIAKVILERMSILKDSEYTNHTD